MKRKIILLFIVLSTVAIKSYSQQEKLIFDMVLHNPGEKFFDSGFLDPAKLKSYGFNGQSINDYQFVHAAITYDSLNPDIFPKGSKERLWAERVAIHIDSLIEKAHAQNLKVYYFTDIIVLPKRLKEIYASEICNEKGQIDIRRPKTQEIHRIMIREIFTRFPALDGLLIRVGETYLHNVPYHTGNGPLLQGEKYPNGEEQVHSLLINLLRDEVCIKYNKKLIYRTWDFGNFHERVPYYLKVTNAVEPHPNLYFCIKHVKGDYHRTLPFNPTLGIGKHKQILEIQCQREYEGKGAYPNYIAEGVINGFEENRGRSGINSAKQLAENPLFSGISTWSRGGGWEGPYITNELWCDLNAYVLANWAKNPQQSEEEIFYEYARMKGFDKKNAQKFRQIALLSGKAVVRGRGSLLFPINVWWTRDHFIEGTPKLKANFEYILKNGLQQQVIAEKEEAVEIWKKIESLAAHIKCKDKSTAEYIKTSSSYGRILYTIYAEGWKILQYGYEGEKSGNFDKDAIVKALNNYNKAWSEFGELKRTHPDCATLYKPEAFWQNDNGMRTWIDHYLKLIQK